MRLFAIVRGQNYVVDISWKNIPGYVEEQWKVIACEDMWFEEHSPNAILDKPCSTIGNDFSTRYVGWLGYSCYKQEYRPSDVSVTKPNQREHTSNFNKSDDALRILFASFRWDRRPDFGEIGAWCHKILKEKIQTRHSNCKFAEDTSLICTPITTIMKVAIGTKWFIQVATSMGALMAVAADIDDEYK